MSYMVQTTFRTVAAPPENPVLKVFFSSLLACIFDGDVSQKSDGRSDSKVAPVIHPIIPVEIDPVIRSMYRIRAVSATSAFSLGHTP